MRTLTSTLLLFAAVCVAAVSASAAESGTVAEGEGPSLPEVERGTYAGTAFGFALSTVPGAGGKLATGSVIELELGYDLSRTFGLGLFVWGGSLTAPGDAALQNGTPVGDFSAIFPGAEVRFYFPIARDSSGVKRLYFGAQGGLGLMMFEGGLTGYPSGAAAPTSPNSDSFNGVAPAGKLGGSLEYFTHLRHFSVGFGVEVVAADAGGSVLVGCSASPFARYSF
jgi:hypothetical protein